MHGKLEHTSGPWIFKLERKSATWPGLYQVDTNILNFGMDGEEGIYLDNPADASLLAAAPDLLAACELALLAFESNSAIDWNILQTAIDKARAVDMRTPISKVSA